MSFDAVGQNEAMRNPVASVIIRARACASGSLPMTLGSYLSPNIQLSSAPIRIALLFPALLIKVSAKANN